MTQFVTATAPDTSDLPERHRRFRDSLFDSGHLIATGVDGVYGRGARFETLVHAIDRLIGATIDEVHGGAATVVSFPPVTPRSNLDRTDYVSSFPHLSAAVSTYDGGEAEHRLMLAGRAAGHDWAGHFRTSDVALVPSACHSVYPTLTGRLPRDGVWVDVTGYCFRREASVDPARMQSFRMREIVRMGSDRAAVAHRDSWAARAATLLQDLGLPVVSAPATDPFFGRAGRILAAGQSSDALKTELRVPVYGERFPGVAVASSNYHRDHFAEKFEIVAADGAPAHSACTGFGIERVALALLATHGLDRDRWPDTVNAQL